MRHLSFAVLCALVLAPAAPAGVYNLNEPAKLVALYTEGDDPSSRADAIARAEAAARLNSLPSTKGAPARIFELRGAAVEPKGRLDPSSPRALYLRQVEYYERMRADGTLGTDDAIALSAAYLRLNDTTASRRVLQAADQSHFLVQAQLAATHQAARNFDVAVERQKRALAIWPKTHAGWTSDQLEFARECEQYNLKLLEMRQKSPDEHPTGPTRLDPLFPGVRFVGDDNKYAPGEIARKEFDKLPKNAGNLVLQLVLWQPRDRRLCWLLAEMLNAFGHVPPAARLLTVMVETEKLEWPELRQHQLVLEKAAVVMRQLEASLSSRYLLSSQMMLLPQGRMGCPVAGDVAYLAGSLVAPTVLAPAIEKGEWGQPGPTKIGDLVGPEPKAMPFNVQHVVVSFIAGVAVASLAVMQWQALRRRRPPATAPPEAVEQQAPPT